MDSSVNGESFMRGETVRVSFDKFVKFDKVQKNVTIFKTS